MMPIMDGFTLLEKLKSNPAYKHIPVIMLTARVELQDRLKALRIGVDDYLTKPFIEEELFARIENLLRNANNRQIAYTVESENPAAASESTPEPTPTVNLDFLKQLEEILLPRIANFDLVVEDIAIEMNLSRRQLFRQIKENIGQTPKQYIKTLRLAKARDLLEDKTYDSVKAVALSVGYKDIKYFSSQFKKAYGRSPSEYL